MFAKFTSAITLVLLISCSSQTANNDQNGEAYAFADDAGNKSTLDSKAGCQVPKASEAVDLGLPSHTLWAPYNIGATKPSDSGYFFAWGETIVGKNYFYWDNYKWLGDDLSLSKYNGKDGLKTLCKDDDAATANWGSVWCTPSAVQCKELINECVWTWQRMNVDKGYLTSGFIVKSKSNDNSIFLPAAGGCMKDEHYDFDFQGRYWTSDLTFDDNPYADFGVDAKALLVDLTQKGVGVGYPCCGMSVRPVLSITN